MSERSERAMDTAAQRTRPTEDGLPACTLRITVPAARALASRLPEKVSAAAYEFITGALLENPRRVGKLLLLPPYEGTRSARRGTYRTLYEIDEENHEVIVTAIDHRADAHRSR
ncbi:type II toxin-antitoxin system RelE/ParE family toxin [Planobispora siamensis]|uniref:Toxin RelG n=1 Tax=Planobispora siamensis TaxID=936338 RepID=A0A8J3WMN2_9ACTN|nr:type II toxin-antitoxin system RelE/ParE family toxin [Planobispora siamensis]GIH96679.1 toxin RelG [Planobispora siamensis]